MQETVISEDWRPGPGGEMFFGGQWRPSASGETFDAISPSTGEVIAAVPQGGRDDARAAITVRLQALLLKWTGSGDPRDTGDSSVEGLGTADDLFAFIDNDLGVR